MGKLKLEKVTQKVETIDFDCGIPSINEYVRESYYPSIAQHAYAYNIVGNEISLGYIQFLFREVELDFFPDDISDIDPDIKEGCLSAVHIRFIAIEKKYQKKDIGTKVLKIIIRIIEALAEEWPISVITIDARTELVSWYEREGFKKMVKNRSGQEGVTVAMYYSCIKNLEELKTYIEGKCPF